MYHPAPDTLPLPAGDANAAADKKALSNAAHAFVTTKIPFDAFLDDSGRLRPVVDCVFPLAEARQAYGHKPVRGKVVLRVD